MRLIPWLAVVFLGCAMAQTEVRNEPSAEFRSIVEGMKNRTYDRVRILYVGPNLTTRTAITKESLERISKCHLTLTPASSAWDELGDTLKSELPIDRQAPPREVRYGLQFERKGTVVARVYFDRLYANSPSTPIAGVVNEMAVGFSQHLPSEVERIVESGEGAKECQQE